MSKSTKSNAVTEVVSPVVVELTAEQILAEELAVIRAEEIAIALAEDSDVVHIMTAEEQSSVDTDIDSVVGLGVKLRGANKTLALNLDSLLAYLPELWIEYDAKSKLAGWRDVEAVRLLFVKACKDANHSNASKAWKDVKKQSAHYVEPEGNDAPERPFDVAALEELTALYKRGARQELSTAAKLTYAAIGEILVDSYKIDIAQYDGGEVEK